MKLINLLEDVLLEKKYKVAEVLNNLKKSYRIKTIGRLKFQVDLVNLEFNDGRIIISINNNNHKSFTATSEGSDILKITNIIKSIKNRSFDFDEFKNTVDEYLNKSTKREIQMMDLFNYFKKEMSGYTPALFGADFEKFYNQTKGKINNKQIRLKDLGYKYNSIFINGMNVKTFSWNNVS